MHRICRLMCNLIENERSKFMEGLGLAQGSTHDVDRKSIYDAVL